MIPCEFCERTHNTPELVEKCKLRKERREERQKVKAADVERRAANQKALSPAKFIQQEVRKGTRWESIVSRLNKDYPIRKQGKWTLWDVVEQDSKKLLDTWPTDLETITALRIERLMTGDYMTRHPLTLPVDGSYSLAGVA